MFQDPGVAYQNQLQEVDVPMRTDDECDQYAAGGIDRTTLVCAGELMGGKDSCQGDSGGPLVVPDAAGKLVQVGVVSSGFGCGFPTQYGVYARVADSALYNWIAARVPTQADLKPPAATPGSGGGSGGGGGGGGGSDAPPSSPGQPSQPGQQGSASRPTKYQRCLARAGSNSKKRRACRYAQQRRVAYRRCRKRGGSVKKCRAQRRAAARRHARALRRS